MTGRRRQRSHGDAVWMWAKLRFVERRDAVAAADDPVDPLGVVLGDLDVHGADVVLELLHRPRANDRAGHAGLIEHPRERELRERTALLLGDRLQSLDDVVDALGEAAAINGVGLICESRAFRQLLAALVF